MGTQGLQTEPAPPAPYVLPQPERPVHPVSAHAGGKLGVCRDQQNDPAGPADGRQPLCDAGMARRPKMPVNHAEPAWQTCGDDFRVRRPDGIGHEQGGGQAGDAARFQCPRAFACSGDQLAPRPALGF